MVLIGKLNIVRGMARAETRYEKLLPKIPSTHSPNDGWKKFWMKGEVDFVLMTMELLIATLEGLILRIINCREDIRINEYLRTFFSGRKLWKAQNKQDKKILLDNQEEQHRQRLRDYVRDYIRNKFKDEITFLTAKRSSGK